MGQRRTSGGRCLDVDTAKCKHVENQPLALDLYNHECTERVYALNDEAALTICDFPSGKRPEIPMKFFSEVMTGFEYSVATLMIYRGMVTEGLELIENIRRRYDGNAGIRGTKQNVATIMHARWRVGHRFWLSPGFTTRAYPRI